MQTFLVRRRGVAASANELDAALTRLRFFEDLGAAPPARWLHSYALREPQGGFGLACLFEADDAAALQRHAQATQLPADEIVRVDASLVARPFAPARVHLVRRRRAWRTAAELERGTAHAGRLADEQMARQLSWLRSYAIEEADGSRGTWCLYQAVDVDALAEHAARAGVPADEIVPVLGRVVFRDDPRDPSRVLDASVLGAPSPVP